MGLRIFLAAIAAALMLSACGGGDEPVASTTPAALAAALRAPALEAPSASVSARAETIFQAAQTRLPTVFTGTATTTSLDAYGLLYRRYSNGLVFAVVVEDKGVGFTLDGLYVVGGPFAAVTFIAKASDIGFGALPATTVTTGATGGTKNLTVTVTVLGTSQTVVVGNVPAPTTQTDFCGGLASDTTFKSLAAAGATFTINSCSFNGSTGNIAATTSAQGFTVSYTIVYTFS